MAAETWRHSIHHLAARLGLRGRRLLLRSGRGAGIWPVPHRRAPDRQSSPHSLVQLVRSSPRLASDDSPPRSRRLLLLSPLLYGPVARGRLTEASTVPFLSPDSRFGYLPVVPL